MTNKLTRNLGDESQATLLTLFSHHWKHGTIWRHSDSTLIPTPHKPQTTTNLRSTSLTACLCKPFEHQVRHCLTPYPVNHDLFPHTLSGVPKHRSSTCA